MSPNCNEIPSPLSGLSKFRSSALGHRCLVDAVILESCHSTWVFDSTRMQFCRILKGIEVAHRSVSTDWRPYWDLEINPHEETFTVYLNVARTRLIQSWRHTHDCVQCGLHETTELSLEDIRHAVHV